MTCDKLVVVNEDGSCKFSAANKEGLGSGYWFEIWGQEGGNLGVVRVKLSEEQVKSLGAFIGVL